jgi:hypothetical protein
MGPLMSPEQQRAYLPTKTRLRAKKLERKIGALTVSSEKYSISRD